MFSTGQPGNASGADEVQPGFDGEGYAALAFDSDLGAVSTVFTSATPTGATYPTFVRDGAPPEMIFVEPSSTTYLDVSISRDGVGGVVGLTVTVAIRRASDGYYLDWNDSTFKASGWTTQNGSMTDLGTGHYQRTWAVGALATGTLLIAEYLSAGVIATHARVQVVKAVADVPGAVWDVVAASHVASGSVGEIATLLRQLGFNKLVETAGNPGTLQLYADDGVTVIKTWQLTDSSSGAVTAQTGAPAHRAAAT